MHASIPIFSRLKLSEIDQGWPTNDEGELELLGQRPYASTANCWYTAIYTETATKKEKAHSHRDAGADKDIDAEREEDCNEDVEPDVDGDDTEWKDDEMKNEYNI